MVLDTILAYYIQTVLLNFYQFFFQSHKQIADNTYINALRKSKKVLRRPGWSKCERFLLWWDSADPSCPCHVLLITWPSTLGEVGGGTSLLLIFCFIIVQSGRTEAIITTNKQDYSWQKTWSVIDLPQFEDSVGGGFMGEIQICSSSSLTDWNSDKL